MNTLDASNKTKTTREMSHSVSYNQHILNASNEQANKTTKHFSLVEMLLM